MNTTLQKVFKKFWQLVFILLFFSFSILPLSSVHGLRIGILPVRLNTSVNQNISKEKANLSRLYQTVWQLSTQKPFSLVRFRYIEAVLKRLKITSFTKYKPSLLKNIAEESDSDALLISELSAVNGGHTFKLTTSLFYAAAQLQTDFISTQCSRLIDCFYFSMKKRYPQISLFSNENIQKKNTDTNNWIFLIDAAASNQKEILALAKHVKQLSIANASLCVLSSNGQISNISFQDKATLISYMQRVKTQNNSKQHFSNLISCGLRQAKFLGSRPNTLLLTGNAPENKVQLRGFMRQLASLTRLTILATGSLHAESLNFWQSLAQELRYSKQTVYKDVIYRRRVGFSDGREFYIFKKGNRLVESNDRFLDANDFHTSVPAHRAEQFSAANLLSIYLQMSKHHIASHSPIDILIPSLTAQVSQDNTAKSVFQENIRVLFEIDGKPFWLSLPSSALTKIQKNNWYYILTFLQAPANGSPLQNNARYTKIFDNKSETSSLLLLPIDAYLKNPQKFLLKSFNKSSWYYIFGQVKAIRSH